MTSRRSFFATLLAPLLARFAPKKQAVFTPKSTATLSAAPVKSAPTVNVRCSKFISFDQVIEEAMVIYEGHEAKRFKRISGGDT